MENFEKRGLLIKNLFLDRTHLDRPIAYQEFKQAGMLDYEYLKYCNFCEGVRGACVIMSNSSNPQDTKHIELIKSTLDQLEKYIGKLLEESFDASIPPYVFKARNVPFYDRSYPLGKDTLSYVATSSKDFRRWLEVFYRKFVLLKDSSEKSPIASTTKYGSKKPLEKEKRESCEFFQAGVCILNRESCISDYCDNYMISTGLPLKRIPTDANTVGFQDLVSLETTELDITTQEILMPSFHDQGDMKPIHKAAYHKHIGDVVQAGMTIYRITRIIKGDSASDTSHHKTCLLSERKKAERIPATFEQHLYSLREPEYPIDLEDTTSATIWAKNMAMFIKQSEEIENKIDEYETWLSI